MEAALTWATLLVGTPYGWWTGGPIPAGPPAWAADGPPPALGAVRDTSCFCAGIPNLMLRHAGLPVPCEANNEYCGGTGAYGLNFSSVAQKFDLEAADSYPRGTLLGMKYHSVARQGHVAVMLGPGKAAMLLQSTANSGPGGRDPTHPGVHANVSLADCFRTEKYCKFEYAVLPQHWIGRKQPPSCQDKIFGECGPGITPGFNVTCCPGAQCKPAQKGAPPVCVPGTEPQPVQTATPTPTPSPTPLPVRVACVGDSITAGYLSSNASFAYPGRLQAQLRSKYGPGKYTVTNFGAGGATVQRGADSPYWNRTQFAAFVNGSNYDIVIIMLGTNDAKDKGNGGAPNWPAACSLPKPSASSCTVVKDYLSLIDVARTLGPQKGTPPQIAIMVPPPLWRDSAYGMNQSVLNDVMPSLVPEIAALAKLPKPIDLFTALGGTSSWRSSFPTCGCQLPPDPALAMAADEGGGNYTMQPGYMGLTRLLPSSTAAPVNYTAAPGFLPDGNDIVHSNLTWAEGIAQCSARSDCAGITFKANSSKPIGKLPLYLKKCGGVERATGWWSWSKPKTGPGAMPTPTMPKACALFCAVGESCDACHPDNDGYNVLASQVFEWIVAHPTTTSIL